MLAGALTSVPYGRGLGPTYEGLKHVLRVPLQLGHERFGLYL